MTVSTPPCSSGHDQVDALAHEPQPKHQRDHNDHLVLVSVDPAADAAQEGLCLFRSETGIDLHGDIDPGGHNAEKEKGYVALPRREFGLGDCGDSSSHEAPGL